MKATEEELRALGMGYRARYLVETSRSICQGEISLEKIQSMLTEGQKIEAKDALNDIIFNWKEEYRRGCKV